MTWLKSLAYLLGLPLLLVLIWWGSTLGRPNFFFPAPPILFDTFGQVWSGERIASDVLPSLGRLFWA